MDALHRCHATKGRLRVASQTRRLNILFFFHIERPLKSSEVRSTLTREGGWLDLSSATSVHEVPVLLIRSESSGNCTDPSNKTCSCRERKLGKYFTSKVQSLQIKSVGGCAHLPAGLLTEETSGDRSNKLQIEPMGSKNLYQNREQR